MNPLVIKLGGALLDQWQTHSATFDALATCLMHAPTVIVHGGGIAVDEQLLRLGITSQKREGIRLTPPEHMDQITGVLAGQMNTRLVGLLLARGVRAVGLTLGDGFSTNAEVSKRFHFNPGRVGDVVDGDMSLLRTLLHAGYVPVLSSIAFDAEGYTLNVNADEAAAAIARLLRASRLVLLTDVPGVKDAAGRVIVSLNATSTQAMIDEGQITGGMIAKVRCALEAASTADVPVLVAGWSDLRHVSSLAADNAVGTYFYPSLSKEPTRA